MATTTVGRAGSRRLMRWAAEDSRTDTSRSVLAISSAVRAEPTRVARSWVPEQWGHRQDCCWRAHHAHDTTPSAPALKGPEHVRQRARSSHRRHTTVGQYPADATWMRTGPERSPPRIIRNAACGMRMRPPAPSRSAWVLPWRWTRGVASRRAWGVGSMPTAQPERTSA